MKFSFTSALVVGLAAQGTVASTWFSKAVYNKWHETELERWLADHNIPYPAPADRKDLENLVKKNWNDQVVTPYNSWDAQQLQSYLALKGYESKKGAKDTKDSLLQQVKNYWTETEDTVAQAYGNTRDWIFNSWSDSQLKVFADKHGIPVPQPRNRDSLLRTARENYESVAKKAKQTTAYPGDWLYDSWSNSDLKAWLDARGYPAPQPTSRDKLIASVRRNSRLASLNLKASASAASASAASVGSAATNSAASAASVASASAGSAAAAASASAASAVNMLSDKLIDSWSDSQIKEWCDKNGVRVPQGSKRNELIALLRKHRAELTGDNVSASATSAYGAATDAYGAATTRAGNEYAQATNYFAWGTNWIKHQIGLAVDTASASAVSATNAAGASASSLSGAAAKSASSLSGAAAKSASSASVKASKSSASASKSLSKSGQKAYDAATESVIKASDYAKEEL
ncbi:hypothetical protein GQ43DRAFT_432067 [Delitschia confertaspora ATCC 74209]|uniref:Uncharacterized protein n=1 Tax=Delitschia confertaspora ATCC 74209 TaxID=1513339 RepID=A0A9P4MYI9_9PLEO|nr:hypothetical protein GQ43DRAFT_432067 [Delitschia confertaspora ATCC 74209]